VHLQNSIQMIDALIKADKPFHLMIYPGKTHSISGKAARTHLSVDRRALRARTEVAAHYAVARSALEARLRWIRMDLGDSNSASSRMDLPARWRRLFRRGAEGDVSKKVVADEQNLVALGSIPCSIRTGDHNVLVETGIGTSSRKRWSPFTASPPSCSMIWPRAASPPMTSTS